MNRTMFSTLRVVGVVAALLAATAGAARAQRAVIRGTVVSEDGQPIEGGSVFIPELAMQTTTDSAGKYIIKIPATRVHGQVINLRARMVGFRPGNRSRSGGCRIIPRGALLDPLFQGGDLLGAELAVHGHGGLFQAAHQAEQAAVLGFSGHQRGAVLATFERSLARAQIEL